MEVSMSKTQEAARAVVDAVRGPLQTLKDAGNVAVPSMELTERAIAGCIGRNGWRKTKPSDEAAGLLWQLVKFHRSGGSLYGFPWFADEGTRDQLDTLAVVLCGGSRAADAWQRAIYG
jgi:hypothetical protein